MNTNMNILTTFTMTFTPLNFLVKFFMNHGLCHPSVCVGIKNYNEIAVHPADETSSLGLMDRHDAVLVVTIWHWRIGQTTLKDPLCRTLACVTARVKKETNTVL